MRFPVHCVVLSYTGLPKANTLLGHNTLRLIGTGDYQGTLKFGESEEPVVVAIAKNAKCLPSAKVVWIAHTNHYALRPHEADVIREISTFIAGLLVQKPTNRQN